MLVVVEAVNASRLVLGEIVKDVFRSSKIKYEVCIADEIAEQLSLNSFSCVILTVRHNGLIGKVAAQKLAGYVESGGGLVALTSTWNEHLSALFGVNAFVPFQQEDSSRTLRIIGDFAPGLKDLCIAVDDHFFLKTPQPMPESGARIMAIDESGLSRAWWRTHGSGKVFCWNTTLVSRGEYFKGLFLQSAFMCQSSAAAPLINAAVIQVDDFPAGYSSEMCAPVDSDLGLSTVEFYNQVWLPDMLDLGRSLDIPFTWFVLFNYNHESVPPFSFDEWEQKNISHNGQSISGSLKAVRDVQPYGELGLHGYNHLPLLESNWPSADGLRASLRVAMQRWKQDNLGELPTCYVPPMNEIDNHCMQILVEEVNSINTICATYFGDIDNGQGRIPSFEPWDRRLIALPRLTYGYEMTAEQRLMMLSSIAHLGIWMHFLHPDDLFDNPSNNPEAEYFRNKDTHSWNKLTSADDNPTLYGQICEWMAFVKSCFPWLSFLTTSDASAQLRKFLDNEINIQIGETEAIIEVADPGDFQLRVHSLVNADEIVLEGATLLHIESFTEHTLFIIRLGKNHCRIQWRASRPQLASLDHRQCFKHAQNSAPPASNESLSRLCFVIDQRGWAFDGIAHNIAKYLTEQWQVVLLYAEDFSSYVDLYRALFSATPNFDLVHFFWRPMLTGLFDSEQMSHAMQNTAPKDRSRFFRSITECCKTTSVYDHLFMGEEEAELKQCSELTHADGYTVASSRLQRIYQNKLEHAPPAAITYDGVDLEMFHVGSKPSTDLNLVVVGWAGNSAWGAEDQDHKGLQTVIKPAIETLKREGLAVEGRFCDKAEEWRPKSKMPEYYRSLDIYVCASLSEGTPNPVLEAMACGLPILSTDVGIVRDVFGPLQQSFVVLDRNASEFTDKLRRLVSDQKLRKQLAQENLVSIERWSWKNQAPAWLSFFEHCLTRHALVDAEKRHHDYLQLLREREAANST